MCRATSASSSTISTEAMGHLRAPISSLTSSRASPHLFRPGLWNTPQKARLLCVHQTFARCPLGDLAPGQRLSRQRALAIRAVQREATTGVEDEWIRPLED